MSESLSASQEDYLEVIYGIAGESAAVRIRDIAALMGVSMASVNGAIKRLEKQDLVSHGKYEYVQLTSKGKKRAARVARRHELLKRFFRDVLGVDEKNSEDDACAAEHHMSETTLRRFVSFFEFLDENPEVARRLRGRIDGTGGDSL